MINSNIIIEFEKLVNFIQQHIESLTDTELITLNTFRLKQIKNALIIIKNYNTEITIDNIKEFGQIQGIGKGTITRIKEIIKTGKLEEINICKHITDENNKIIKELESITGIGHIGALKLLKNGVRSIEDLKNKIDLGEIKVNNKIKLGLGLGLKIN
jgi:DNA polymerase/3'-5' exonuclease PolX